MQFRIVGIEQTGVHKELEVTKRQLRLFQKLALLHFDQVHPFVAGGAEQLMRKRESW